MHRAVLLFPPPMSANDMYRNVSKEERKAKNLPGMALPGRVKTPKYQEWSKLADDYLTAQRRPRFSEPVAITLWCGEVDAAAKDADNCLKPVIDSLVRAGVIKDDSKEYVRGTASIWVPMFRCTVVVIERAGATVSPSEVAAMVPNRLLEGLQ